MKGRKKVSRALQKLAAGDRISLLLRVSGKAANSATVTVSLVSDKGQTVSSVSAERVPRNQIEGWFGIVGKGLLDFEVNTVLLSPESNLRSTAPQNECLNCYAIGSTLKQEAEKWTVQFVGMFRNDGRKAEIRVADLPDPQGGWSKVPFAGSDSIVNNEFRRNTAAIYVTLPKSPAETTLYYTVWKDGIDGTVDARVGTDSTGPGTEMVGDVPSSGQYVGRLPQLIAPYRLCGLSCHAINRGVADPSRKNRTTGKDGDYMRRNFQIVQHLISGEEQVDPTANSTKWRQWRMPNRDFSLLVLDSRLWRTSQDTKMWDDEGWGHINT